MTNMLVYKINIRGYIILKTQISVKIQYVSGYSHSIRSLEDMRDYQCSSR